MEWGWHSDARHRVDFCFEVLSWPIWGLTFKSASDPKQTSDNQANESGQLLRFRHALH